MTAGCTDGNVYVWDTAQDDLPMCVLGHGEPVEELLGEREQEDVGVKFTAWGTTLDRLYTGSSDGVVKVWNVRHGRAVLVRDLVEASGPIICGAFSPDATKLAIGDGTGRVYLITLGDEEDEAGNDRHDQNQPSMTTVSSGALNASAFVSLDIGGRQQAIRRPRPFIPHPEVPPPATAALASPSPVISGREIAAEYLRNGELVLHPDEAIGAVQGPNYAQTGLFRAEAHIFKDVTQPLTATFTAKQQKHTDRDMSLLAEETTAKRQQQRRQESISSGYNKNGNDGDGDGDGDVDARTEDMEALRLRLRDTHLRNIALDKEIEDLPADTQAQLIQDGVNQDFVSDYVIADYAFSYEE